LLGKPDEGLSAHRQRLIKFDDLARLANAGSASKCANAELVLTGSRLVWFDDVPQ